MQPAMKTCRCSSCGTTFPGEGNRKRALQPNYSVLGPVGTLIADLRDFDRVICPNCGCEFRSASIKMFGLFSRPLYWVPFVALAVAFLATWLYLQ